MRVEWGSEDLISAWVAGELGLTRDFGPCRTAAVIAADGSLAAGVVFHRWDPEAGVIEVSAAARNSRWASRGVLAELFGYAFAHNQACVAQTDTGNHRVRRLWKAFGATEYIIPRLRGRMASAAILLLTDDAWAKSRFTR